MPKQVIVNMAHNYPFGQCEDGDDQSVRILVRRSIECGAGGKESTLTRANFFRRLNQSCIIKLQQVLEEETAVTLLYEYVPIRMQTWISNINEKFIEGFCKQLIQLGDYLAKCYISAEIRLENVGMDENYKPKYFLDLDFTVDESIPKATLRSKYQQEVLQLFKPYVQNKLALKGGFPSQSSRGKESSNSHRQEYSPGTIVKYKGSSSKADKSDLQSVASTMRLREKAVALQKQRKNQSINVCGSQFDLIPFEKNRKQSILSSVSNVKISRLGRKIDQIKSKLRNIYSPEPFYIRHEEKSIEKRDNGIAFNYGSTQKVFANASNPKIKALDSSAFCQNILRDLQHEQSIFQKFQKNLAKQICGGGLPLKKNETLKEKQYQQMKKSDDGYFKDFFSVLQDKPKQLLGEQRPLMLDNVPFQMDEPRQAPARGIEKPHMLELENRVKSAINKSKTLINKFKGQR